MLKNAKSAKIAIFVFWDPHRAVNNFPYLLGYTKFSNRRLRNLSTHICWGTISFQTEVTRDFSPRLCREKSGKNTSFPTEISRRFAPLGSVGTKVVKKVVFKQKAEELTF